MHDDEAGALLQHPAMAEIEASLHQASLGIEALMDLMAHLPDGHHIRTQALHALMMGLADLISQAARACHTRRPVAPEEPP